MARVLVTGGAGFIGSHLTERLVTEGNEVVVVDTLLRGNKIPREIFKQIRFHQADVRDAAAMDDLSKGCDAIYHFAAVLGVDIVADNPVETMEVETIGTRNIAHAAIKNDVPKLLYASTSGIYGHSAMEKAVDEDVMVDPRTSYAMAKRYNEIYLAALNEEKGLDTISLRFFNVYGPRQDNRMVIPRFIEQALAGKDITVFGNGKQTRDFTYIDDTIEACMRLTLLKKGSDVFNISNENEGCIEELAFQIKKLTNSASAIKYIEAPRKRYDYEVERRVGSSKKLFDAVGYKPNTTLEEGLQKILSTIN
jgi:UDP-glucose 4-epimerase